MARRILLAAFAVVTGLSSALAAPAGHRPRPSGPPGILPHHAAPHGAFRRHVDAGPQRPPHPHKPRKLRLPAYGGWYVFDAVEPEPAPEATPPEPPRIVVTNTFAEGPPQPCILRIDGIGKRRQAGKPLMCP